MLDTVQNLSLTTLMVIVGPVLLALGLAYGIMRSRKRSRAAMAHTDAATKSLYRQGAAQDRREE